MTTRQSAVTVMAVTAVLFGLFRVVGWLDIPALQTPWSEGLLKVGVWALPSIGVMCLAWRRSLALALAELGLSLNPVGFGVALLASLPMLIAPAHGAWPSFRSSTLASTVLLAPITEEILFRGLLFRQLYRHGGRTVLRAAIVSAITFAAAHVTPGDLRAAAWTPLAGQLGTTALVGMALAWLVYRWDSLWPAIGLHACLNLSWELYGRGFTDSTSSTLLWRVASIALLMIVTARLRPLVHLGAVESHGGDGAGGPAKPGLMAERDTRME